jgi:hypothetical protein
MPAPCPNSLPFDGGGLAAISEGHLEPTSPKCKIYISEGTVKVGLTPFPDEAQALRILQRGLDVLG